MFTISKKNCVPRWAFLFTKVPGITSTCELFWRSVLITPLKLIRLALLGILASGLSVIIWEDLWVIIIGTLVVAGFIATLFLIAWFVDKIGYVVKPWFIDIKEKHCTIVTLI